MNKLNLNHELTPKSLIVINDQLAALLQSETLDDFLLKSLIEQRDVVVTQHLQQLNHEQEVAFAKLEWQVNQDLSTVIEKQLSESLKKLSGLLRGRKAVNKYK